jgi:hypothetical protein
LGNVWRQDFADLADLDLADLALADLALRRAKERLRHKRHVLLGCIMECGYLV